MVYVNKNFLAERPFVSVDQAIYATSIVAKYLDTATSDEKIEKLTREYNINFRSCIGSLIYLLSTRVDLSFAVHKLAKFSVNPGKVHFEGLVHLLRYIRDNKTLGLKYYDDFNDAPVTDILIQANNRGLVD